MLISDILSTDPPPTPPSTPTPTPPHPAKDAILFLAHYPCRKGKFLNSSQSTGQGANVMILAIAEYIYANCMFRDEGNIRVGPQTQCEMEFVQNSIYHLTVINLVFDC